MKAKALLGWGGSVILGIMYSLLLAGYGVALIIFRKSAINELVAFLSLFVVLFIAVFVGFLGCALLLCRICRLRNLDTKGYWRGLGIVLAALLLIGLMRDVPPLENDYCLQDITSSDPHMLESYEILKEIKKQADAIMPGEVLFKRIKDVAAESELIYQAWDSIADIRSLIETLDTYSGIVDLTPGRTLTEQLDITAGIRALRLKIAEIYSAYVRLQAAEGEPDEGAHQLATFHSVTQKALSHATSLGNKVMWLSIAQNNIRTAYSVMQDPHCTANTIEILREAFTPIPLGHVSMRSNMINEYIFYRDLVMEQHPGTLLDGYMGTIDLDGARQHAWPTAFRRIASSLIAPLILKKNRTQRDMRHLYGLVIEAIDQHPPVMQKATAYARAYTRRPDIRNLVGWYCVSLSAPVYARNLIESSASAVVLSDLLAIEIGDRLNKPVELRDYYSGDVYLRNEQTGRAFSVGPDRIPYSGDDITLDIGA